MRFSVTPAGVALVNRPAQMKSIVSNDTEPVAECT
jgi:hypothetical protein